MQTMKVETVFLYDDSIRKFCLNINYITQKNRFHFHNLVFMPTLANLEKYRRSIRNSSLIQHNTAKSSNNFRRKKIKFVVIEDEDDRVKIHILRDQSSKDW